MKKAEVNVQMMLLPPAPGKCPECAVRHLANTPHDKDSLYYQTKFYMEHGRYPTWRDAISNCTPDIQEYWIAALTERGVPID